jgi:hypothetical protein
MKTLSTPAAAQIVAPQSAWAELYDLYLSQPITTPWGTTNILRLTNYPGGLAFPSPAQAPEPASTQGDTQSYLYWPIKRQAISADAKYTADQFTVVASNISGEWAAMLAALNWYDTPIVIRKLATSIASPVGADAALLFSGAVDSADVTPEQIQLSVSNDFGSLNTVAPRENLHQNCRFQWADDLCTALRFHPNNYRALTVDIEAVQNGRHSSLTEIFCSALLDDTALLLDYPSLSHDEVNNLNNSDITASSEVPAWTNQAVTLTPHEFLSGNYDYFYVTLANHKFSLGDPFQFNSGTLPGYDLALNTTYYAVPLGANTFKVASDAAGSIFIKPANNATGSGIHLTSTSPGTAASVKVGNSGTWKISVASDWGDASQGYWLIPSAQAGLHNPALKPWIQFHLGGQMDLWRLKTRTGGNLDSLVRLVQIFTSVDGTNWTWRRDFECPPQGGVWYDMMVRDAPVATQYYRLCIRSTWGTQTPTPLLEKVSAFYSARNFWAWGVVTFVDDTLTPELRGVRRRDRKSVV